MSSALLPDDMTRHRVAPLHATDEAPTRDLDGSMEIPSDGTPAEAAKESRYVALEEIGRGGMGRVLRAYDTKLQREVALKQVHGNALGEDATRRLVAEARAMAKLSHPNVVAVYDVEERPSGEVVLVMEYVAGQTLSQWLRASPRGWREIVDCFIEAGRGLRAAHDAQLLHRDFKPSNVLVSTSGHDVAPRRTVKVTDFGLAKLAIDSPSSGSSSALSGEASSQELTEHGTILGTPRYMAPEQYRGEPLTEAADQYAFCVALWHALCDRPPFPEELRAMREAKEAGPPAWPNPSTPRPLAEAVVRGLLPDPNARWPSMTALLEALAYDPARRRTRWLLASLGVAVLGLGGLSAGLWAQARAQRCSGARQQLAGTWDDARRAEVQAAIVGIGRVYADDVWARTQQQLDEYADDWTAMHTEACEATTIRGEQSLQRLDLQMECLRRAKVALGATVDTLADADADMIRRAHHMVDGLEPLARCADSGRGPAPAARRGGRGGGRTSGARSGQQHTHGWALRCRDDDDGGGQEHFGGHRVRTGEGRGGLAGGPPAGRYGPIRGSGDGADQGASTGDGVEPA